MPRRHRLAGAAAIAAAALALPAAAGAQELTTPTKGFGLKLSANGRLKLDIGPAANPVYKRLAGRRAVLSCQQEPTVRRPGFFILGQGISGQSFRFRLPDPRRGLVVGRDVVEGLDACSLRVPATRGRPSATLLLPITTAGQTAITERLLVARMAIVAGLVGQDESATAYPTTAALVAEIAGDRRLARAVGPVEAISGPDGGPATPGAIGVWTDGGSRAIVVGYVSPERRVTISADGENVTFNSPYLYAVG